MNKRRTYMLSALAMTLPLLMSAQVRKHLTIEQAIEISSKQNATIHSAELDHRIAGAERHQTDAVFLPQVSLGYSAMVTNNPLNAFGFLLQQSRVETKDFDPARLNAPGASQNYAASVDLQMPLLNLDLIYARKGARMQEEVYKNKVQYTKNYVRFEVQKAYTQLQFAYSSRDILRATLEDVQTIHQSVKNFYAQGLVQKSDVLNAQVQVNTIQSALAKAESAIFTASDALKVMMGINDDAVFTTDALIQKNNYASDASLLHSRPDVVAMQKAYDASKIMTKSSAMKFLPSINAFGSYQFNDAKIFGFKEDSYLMGISLNWKIFSGNSNRSKYRASQLKSDKMQNELKQYIDKSRMEIDKTTRDLSVLQTEIDKQETSVTQAAEALRILSNRFAEGLASTTDLLQAQAQHSQQQLLLAQAVMTYNITSYYKQFITTAN